MKEQFNLGIKGTLLNSVTNIAIINPVPFIFDLEMRSINRFLTAVNSFIPEDIIRGKDQITSPFDDDTIM